MGGPGAYTILAGVFATLVLTSGGLLTLTSDGPALSGAVGPHQGTYHSEFSVPSRSTYTVRFVAYGLETGVNWTASLGVLREWSKGTTTLAFLGIANGTYGFVVSAVGEVAAPAFGSLTVHGMDVNLTVSFSPAPPQGAHTTSGPPLPEVLAIVGAVVAVVVVAAALLARRGRRRREILLSSPRTESVPDR